MDAEQIRRLKPELEKYLDQFADCFGRKDSRAHLPVYIRGQLSDLPAKSVEPMADAAGVAPRTLQEFLSMYKWDENRMRDRVQELVIAQHAGTRSIGLIDETSDRKSGDKTPGVQRQWCGRLGKKENCIVTVHLGYALDDFHCMLDAELYLPKSWADDRARCREAGIPDNMVYRSKCHIALELYDRAVAKGVRLEWLTFDEGYGAKPWFLRALRQRQQPFVCEIPKTFTGWIDPPRVTDRPYRRGGRGRRRKTPRLVSGSPAAQSVEDMLAHQPVLRDQPWQPWRIKDGTQGPVVWEVKHVLFHPRDEQGLPDKPYHLIVARNVLHPTELKFFCGDGPPDTGLGTLLLVGFSRWRIERCIQDQKSELGLDQYEGRWYLGLKRHLILTMVSYLFLVRTTLALGGKKSRPHSLPSAYRGGRPRPVLVAERAPLHEARGTHRTAAPKHASAKRQGPPQPQSRNTTKTAGTRHQAHQPSAMHLGYELAL